MSESTRNHELNPLLAAQTLPQFSAIKPEHVEPAVREVLAEQRRALVAAESVATPDLDWLRRLEHINTEIERVWGPISHLNSVVSSPPLREAFNRCLPLIAEFGTELGQNETLYRHFSTLQAKVGAAKPVEQQLISNALRDFRLGGVTLTGRRGSASARSCSSSPRNRPSSSRTSWTRRTPSSITRPTAPRSRGCRSSCSTERPQLPQSAVSTGWCLRLDPPTYQTVLAHAESPALREKYYRAWVTRASDQGPHAGRWDNGALIEEILALRHEAAQLVGFKTFAEFSLGDEDGGVAEPRHRVLARSRAAQPRRSSRGARDARRITRAASSTLGTCSSMPNA